MAEQQQDYVTPLLSEFNTKLRDIEEKQKLLKDRVLLIGENLISSREESEVELAQLKVNVEQMKLDMQRVKETLERFGDELENKARRGETEILRKQFKMFEPLEFATIEDVKKLIKENK
jgi:hypothetical protein